MQLPNPNNITKKNILVFLFFILFCISIFFNLKPKKTIDYSSEEVKRLRAKRDSILDLQITESRSMEAYYHSQADSRLQSIKQMEKKDSINLYYYAKEKSKFNNLPNPQRHHVLDSLFRANGIR